MPSVGVRDLKKERYWRKRVRDQAGSGLSIRAWCRKHGEKEPLFHWWRRELARRDAQNAQSAFVPVRVRDEEEPTAVGGCIEIVLAGGRRVRINGRVDGQMLSEVLTVLEGRAC